MLIPPELLSLIASIDSSTIAGVSLWTLTLYLSLSSVGYWLAEELNRWFNFAEQALLPSRKEFEHTQPLRESLNALYASVLSLVPFFACGAICNYGVEVSLGRSWAISIGLLACLSCGVYELGRRSGHAFRE
jgi:hypothetical protein